MDIKGLIKEKKKHIIALGAALIAALIVACLVKNLAVKEEAAPAAEVTAPAPEAKK